MGMHRFSPGGLHHMAHQPGDPESAAIIAERSGGISLSDSAPAPAEKIANILLRATGVDHSGKTLEALNAIHDGGLNISMDDPFLIPLDLGAAADEEPELFIASDHSMIALEGIVREGGANALAASQEIAQVLSQISQGKV